MLATHNAVGVNASYRVQFRFWLDVVKDPEASLAQEVQSLKTRRVFQPTVRDAMRLILDLRRGKTDVLQELFPWVVQHPPSTSLRPAKTTTLPEPDLSKIDLKTTIAKSDENPTFNILLSSVGMGIAKLEDMPTPCLEYGIARGKVSRSQAEKILSARRDRESGAKKEQGIKTIEGANVQFTAPDFDDLDL